MNNEKYNELNSEELEKILRYFYDEANSCMTLLDSIMGGKNADEKLYENILKKYAHLKAELKEIYHFINLGINENYSDPWYTEFKEAISDMHCHATAKTNTRKLRELFSSLYDIQDYAAYKLHDLIGETNGKEPGN